VTAKKRGKKEKPQEPSTFTPDQKPALFMIIILAVLLIVLYHQVILGGMVFQPPDRMTTLALQPFVQQALSQGIYPLWCPYVFSGMPSFASMLTVPMINIVDWSVRTVLQFILPRTFDPNFIFIYLNFLLLAATLYLLLRQQKISPLAASFSAIAVTLLPQFVAFVSFSHNTKFLSVVLIPLIFYLTKKMFEERSLLYFCLTALAIGFQLFRAHVQVTYYTFLMLGIYLVFTAVARWRENRSLKPFFVNAGLLIGAIAAGLLLSSVIYLSVYEYQHYSIRGSSENSGLDYDYASSWSFHPLEMVTFIIPSFMGFGGQTYWGKMPFTDYPLYFGIGVLFLAGLALVLRRDRKTWFFTILAIFALVVSFGKHLPVLYTPMFKLLPFFNKFRIPSMIHILLNFSMVVLAAYGLQALFDYRKQLEKMKKPAIAQSLRRYLYIFLAVVGIFLLFMLFAKSFFIELIAESRARMQPAQRELAYNNAFLDSFKALIFIAITVFIVFQFLRFKLSRSFLGVTLIILMVIDFWIIDFKIINPRPPASETAHFSGNAAVDYMKKDKSQYRIFPVLDNKGGNWYAHHLIESINGYSAAKLRIYQDFLEETGFASQDQYGLNPFIINFWNLSVQEGKLTPQMKPPQARNQNQIDFHNTVLDMLNVKYLVINYLPIPDPGYQRVQHQQPWVFENVDVLPRAFFADTVQVMEGRETIFSYMKSGKFDPRQTAIVEKNPPFDILPSDSNRVRLQDFGLHHIRLNAEVFSPTVMVLSEIYYPAGWRAFVDGVETPIYKTNYILRSVFLEPGNHTIEFIFKPKRLFLGIWISIATFLLLLIPVGLWLYKTKYKKCA
jgi:hypothetical protein